MAQFGGRTFDPALDADRLRRQLGVVFELMADGQWWTLSALVAQAMARHGCRATEAAVSARIRDLRKARFGGHTVDRMRDMFSPGLWHYRLVIGRKPVGAAS